MVREDTEAPSEGATYAWMAADEVFGCTRAFLTVWRSSRRLICRGVMNLVFVFGWRGGRDFGSGDPIGVEETSCYGKWL
ncbi:hypothetical protein TNCV_1628691 [Trichonephila clavipes]|nr:hypothetical protein TNCV_1628691 [Trichonephila clavipes]